MIPTQVRATGHGISAGIGKFGAFIGVFLFPVLQDSLGLRGTLLLISGVSVLGALLTLVLPEPAGLRLEESPVNLFSRVSRPNARSAPARNHGPGHALSAGRMARGQAEPPRRVQHSDVSQTRPRTVNNVCVAALIATAGAGKNLVDHAAARAAIAEITATD